MSRFSLDVDPSAVEASARQAAEVGAALQAQSAAVARAGGSATRGWQGAAAATATLELSGLSRELTGSAPHLSDARDVLVRLAEAYREGELAVAALNRRWEQAEASSASAVAAASRRESASLRDIPPGLPPEDRDLLRQGAERAAGVASAAAAAELAAAQRALEREYDELVDDLTRETTRAGAELAAATVVPVPAATLTAAALARSFGGIFGVFAYPTVDASSVYGATLPLAELTRQLADPPRDLAGLEQLLDRARTAGLHPTDYQRALEQYWTAEAFREAGIDPALWDPARGAEANREIIERVYEYYGRLYLDNPYMQWAGMAKLIGPSFAAGFFDLNLLQRSADAYARTGAPGLPPGMEAFAAMGAADVRWYETTFLDMQRKIFLDQAPMHEAYEGGGPAAIRELVAAGVLPASMGDAWQDIHVGRTTGDEAALARGNTALLRREQFDVIATDYDRMRARPVTGEAMTFMMTLVGGPSIPGARSYPDVFPLTVPVVTPGAERLGTPESVFGIDLPHVSVDNPVQGTAHVQTPFPDGNIASREQRWLLIEQDTLPAYQELLRDDPDAARALIAAPVGPRIEEQHLYTPARVREDVEHLLTDWDVEFEQ